MVCRSLPAEERSVSSPSCRWSALSFGVLGVGVSGTLKPRLHILDVFQDYVTVEIGGYNLLCLYLALFFSAFSEYTKHGRNGRLVVSLHFRVQHFLISFTKTYVAP